MSMSASSSSGSDLASRGASNSRSRRSLPAPAPATVTVTVTVTAVRGWIPSSSSHASTTVSFNIGGDASWTPSSPRSHTGMDIGRGKGKEKEKNPGGGGVEERLSVYASAARGETSTSTSTSGSGGGGGWGSFAGLANAALGVTAYRYLSRVQSNSVKNDIPEVTPEFPEPETTIPDPQPRADVPTETTDDICAAIQEAISTPTRPPPLLPVCTDTSPDTGSFEWSTLHRHDRYRPPSRCRLSRLSNLSHGSTLSSVFSYEPLTPDTPRTFALPSVSDTDVSPTKLPSLPFRLQRHPETAQNVGLGLELVDAQGGQGEEGEEEDIDPDPEGASRVLERLDTMLLEIQALTERGEMALATPKPGYRAD